MTPVLRCGLGVQEDMDFGEAIALDELVRKDRVLLSIIVSWISGIPGT